MLHNVAFRSSVSCEFENSKLPSHSDGIYNIETTFWGKTTPSRTLNLTRSTVLGRPLDVAQRSVSVFRQL